MTDVKKWYAPNLTDVRVSDEDFLVVDYRDYRALENKLNALQFELLKLQASVAVGPTPGAQCRQRLIHEGKPYPKSSCKICGQFAPNWQECHAAIIKEKDNE